MVVGCGMNGSIHIQIFAEAIMLMIALRGCSPFGCFGDVHRMRKVLSPLHQEDYLPSAAFVQHPFANA